MWNPGFTKTRNRVCIKKSKHHFLHHQTLEAVFHDHIKHFKVVKILCFACVFSSPLSMFEMSQPVERLSVWGKKQRGKGREMKGGGVAFPSPQFHTQPKGFWKLLSLKTLFFKWAVNHLSPKRDQHYFSPKYQFIDKGTVMRIDKMIA